MVSSLAERVTGSKEFRVIKKTMQSRESICPISYVIMESALDEVS